MAYPILRTLSAKETNLCMKATVIKTEGIRRVRGPPLECVKQNLRRALSSGK
jgi:hypothetical protein